MHRGLPGEFPTGRSTNKQQATAKQEKNADLQGSAPSFEEDFGLLEVNKELNCVPILLVLMQNGVYLSYTHSGSVCGDRNRSLISNLDV